MRTFTLPILVAAILVGTCVGQTVLGSNVVQSVSAQVDSPSIIDATVFTGTDMCQKINNAITTVITSPAPVTIDARGFTGMQNCGSNPFGINSQNLVNAAAYTGRLLLGGVTINTSVQWTMPNQYFWIEGIAMANVSSTGTVIKATSNFNCNSTGAISVNVASPVLVGCPVVFISGTGFSTQAYDSLGTGIRNLTIDCSSLSGCIGAGAFDVQEGGGIDTVGFINQNKACVVFDTAEVHVGGATGVSNPFLRNIDCVFMATPSNTAIGIYVNAQDGPAEISNTTVAVPGATVPISSCLDLNGGRGTNVNYFHCEHANTAEIIGDSNLVHDVTINGLTASATPLGVWLKNTGDYDITVHSVELEPTSPLTGVLTDAVNSVTITANNVAQYVMNQNGTVFTTDPGTPSFIPLARFNQARLTGFTLSQLLVLNPPGGSVAYCSDCRPNSGTNGCSSGGTGALALRTNLNWYCK